MRPGARPANLAYRHRLKVRWLRFAGKPIPIPERNEALLNNNMNYDLTALRAQNVRLLVIAILAPAKPDGPDN
jgi:hypothetical protein